MPFWCVSRFSRASFKQYDNCRETLLINFLNSLFSGNKEEKTMKNFSPEWNQCYKDDGQMIRWPWSDIISYVMRHARPQGSETRVLEIGIGSGANISFFASFGVQLYGIDGSEHIISYLHEKHPEYRETIVQGDFTEAIPFEGQFDLIIDRASLTHNPTPAIRKGLSLVFDKLKPGGTYVGVDWFSTNHSEYQNGIPTDDPYTRRGYEEGTYAGLGMVHFSDKNHLLSLFENFKVLVVDQKIYERAVPDNGYVNAVWNIVARKPA